ncbi:hypothetical protein UA08_02715 [Talaromyces atroroseus]|uniref:Cyclin-D1-binding protein 1-like N-terminal domain-containing protein n=1 Tax=Talaromyces atroroseus TaxID=1441469 RepID=A0A225AYQ8_TALAT|nr:hypothetical protein UA08_02715 [Talaromyces atroroseus]OKL62488.1 hypothetical protein UA08_02715 [Talaromyces atroroseus]
MSEKLHILLETALALSAQFQTTLDTTPPTAATAENDDAANPSPLVLLSNSAKTLRAQVTKLSLLTITAPFTPSALCTSLTPVNDSVMPSMVTAVLMLTPGEYTKAFSLEARLLVKTALKEFSVLVEAITSFADELKKGEKKSELSKSEKEAITSQTGRVWDACDTITTLVTQGVVGHVVRRVQEWHDLVKDAISELEEWDPEEDDADFEELLDVGDETAKDIEKNGKESDEEEEDDDIEALHEQKKSLLRALKPIAQIYPAIISNRCKKGGLTASKSQIAKLESLTSDLQSIPGHVDEAAGSLYESNLDDSVRYLNKAKTTAERAIELVIYPWTENSTITEQQQGDKFTIWSTTWRKVMGNVIKDIQS